MAVTRYLATTNQMKNKGYDDTIWRSLLIPYSTFLPSDVRIMAEHPLDIYVLNG
ncbi:Uncharacterized protein APZ42_009662 [Daphnia magna]|uniref:Uncharacterized protein n=1 Tax=Daphnia magna TaxID=35525 RepID=A0A164DVU0_9CRUS|nr:Uncharacterized protein APZ42_009662 [Daphnia magna]